MNIMNMHVKFCSKPWHFRSPSSAQL